MVPSLLKRSREASQSTIPIPSGGRGGYEIVKEYDLVEHGKAAMPAGAKATPTGETTVVLDPEFCSLTLPRGHWTSIGG